MPETKEAEGSRGSWFATVDGERLPCVHQKWFRAGRYDDPCVTSAPPWPEFIQAIREGLAVILTSGNAVNDDLCASITRTGYIGRLRTLQTRD